MWAKHSLRFYSSTRYVKSPFDILQLPRHASQGEIKKKYYELAKAVHPDRGNMNNDATAFQEVSDAYEFLKHPDKRNLYLKTGYGWDSTILHHQHQHHQHPYPSPSPSSGSAYYTADNVTYKDGPWSSHRNTRYASNVTIFCVLSGITFTLTIINFMYTPFATSWIKALDNHHAKSSRDLERARTNAQRYGNEAAVQRVMQAYSPPSNNKTNFSNEEPSRSAGSD
ncbi:DnaJ domain-containing protein [Absidia repens]|uniref:DnaJ domain-containing protein n=1 Tax=Absidia repens TaxID=90262 RepID=A0A1X2I482_9FUNG|nr:DnaJ domain-containing protein [Absidia repens]